MTIQPIGPASVALYLTPADLREHGATPADLPQDVALTLTRRAFLQAGLPVEGPMEIDAYPDSCGVLVFARLREPQPVFFLFPDLEGLLEAARSLPSALPGAALYFDQEQYWLSVPGEEEQALCRLSEFGQRTAGSCLEARLREHGTVLIPGAALDFLLRCFPDE